MEYAKQPNFCCQPIWIVIYTNCWCDFSMAALKSVELSPFSLQGVPAAPLSLPSAACLLSPRSRLRLHVGWHKGDAAVAWALSSAEVER